MPRGRKKKIDNNSIIIENKNETAVTQNPMAATKKRGRKPKEKKYLYMVYWNSGDRKALVAAKDEEDAKVEARRFAGNYKEFYKVEYLGFEQKD